MADQINTAAYETPLPPREIHDAGSFVAQCVDVIDLGKRPETFQGEDKGAVPKCAIVWRTGELNSEGKPLDVSREYTISTGRKASLRKDCEAWRGAAYADDYPDIPLHLLAGKWCTLTIVHQKSGAGKEYAKVTGVSGVPKGMALPADQLGGYERAEWWEKRKSEYAKEWAEYERKKGGAKPSRPAPPPPPQAEDFAPYEDEVEFEGEDESSLTF
jgi:hypothetical protein